MTSTMARLVLAMLLLPASGAVFLLAFVAVIRPTRPPDVLSLLFVWLVVYLFASAYWVALWWRTVNWHRRRVVRTFGISALSLASGVAAGIACAALGRWVPVQIAVLVGGGIVPIAWVLGTVVIWRETPDERASRLAILGSAVLCPRCGYNLAGLREARCPECGASFTLDQLLATQPRAAEAAETE